LAWSQQNQATASRVDLLTLSNELKILRILSNNYSKGIAKCLTRNPVLIPSDELGHNTMAALISEYSDIGYLDKFVTTHMSICPMGFQLSDIKCCAQMLLDALLHCQRMNVCHRDIRPSHILVTRPFRYQKDLLLGQFNLKLCDFRLSGLSGLYSPVHDPEQERY
jgi:serine/threonine protein kinase